MRHIEAGMKPMQRRLERRRRRLGSPFLIDEHLPGGCLYSHPMMGRGWGGCSGIRGGGFSVAIGNLQWWFLPHRHHHDVRVGCLRQTGSRRRIYNLSERFF